MKQLAINHFLDYEFVYIFLLLFLIFLLMAIFIKKQTIRKISIIFFSIFFMFFCFEFIISFYVPQYVKLKFDYKTINTNHSEQIYKERDIRFIDKITKETKEFVNDKDVEDKYYDTNRFILSCSKLYTVYENTRFRQTCCNINSKYAYVFLGCSFVFGHGLDDNETLPYYFSKKLDFRYNIINYGVPGKSINTAINILNTNLNRDIKYCHFFFVMIRDHIQRNFRLTNYRNLPNDEYLFINNKIKKIKQPYYNIINIFKRNYIFKTIFLPYIYEHNEQYYEDYMINGLKTINKIIKEKYDSKLTIIIYEHDSYGNTFIKRLKETNLDLILLPDKFDSEKEGYRIKNDLHPSAKANEEIADILYDHINNLK